MNDQFDYDLFVIGAGSGGVRASRMSAAYGARVAIAEESRVGGTCVIRGCIPKKLLVYASQYSEAFEDARGFGWQVPDPAFSWETLLERKNREIDRLNGVYLKLLANSGVTLFPQRATVSGPNAVTLADGTRVSASHILIATGGWPAMPPLPGIEHALSSNEALELPHLPERIAIVGGGYIAVEFAGIFNGLGSQVSLIYRGERILRGFDDDLRDVVTDGMRAKGIAVRNDTNVTAIERLARADALRLQLDDGTSLECGAVLYATGRTPNTHGLGLAEQGVGLAANGAVLVDAFSRTSVASIHAIGDVTDRIALTPVAIREGAALAATLFGAGPVAADFDNVPSAVFSHPEIATVGLTEAQARAQFGAVDIYKTTFRPLRHMLSEREDRILMKLVVDRASQRVVGAHMAGTEAAEIVQGIAIAVKMGATKAQFDSTVGIHPSAAEEFVTMRERSNPDE
jgi:glutathione reductase (NADPH)